MIHSTKYCVSIALVFLLAGCTQQNTPVHILDKEKFPAVYVALMEAKAKRTRLTDHTVDTTFAKDKEEIFTKFGATEEEFRATVLSYGSDVRKWREFYDDVVRRLEQKSREKN